MSLMRWARDALAPVFAKRYKTMFGTAKIYETSWEDTRIRVLEVDGTYQSASYLGERWCEVPFPYLALYDAIFNTDTHMDRICMLGGGGFAFPKHVVAHRSSTAIDVVEIDPAIIRIANEHFFLDKLEETYHATEQGRLAIHCGDALAYLEECKRAHTRYDAILNDCFAGAEANDELATPAAIDLVDTCLVPGGLYLTNVITALEGEEAQPLERLVMLLSERFGHICALSCDRTEPDERDNVVVVASDRDPNLRDALRLYDRTS